MRLKVLMDKGFGVKFDKNKESEVKLKVVLVGQHSSHNLFVYKLWLFVTGRLFNQL